MKKLYNFYHYFSWIELTLWFGSLFVISLSFLIFSQSSYLTLVASLIGVTALIFVAKGNPFGQFLVVVFSLIYGLLSWNFAYYGEVATYIGMTMPMAVFGFISWMKHPYEGNRSEVQVNHLSRSEWLLMIFLTGLVTFCFYFILDYFNTANMLASTISVTTSFAAVYLTFKRSPYYAVGYAFNDIVLVILWSIASIQDSSYFCLVVCFIAFLFNDIYAYINWQRMSKKQAKSYSAT